MLKAACLGIAIAVAATAPAQALVRGKPVHGLSLYGEPKYGPDFTHFDYVNPNAPKGGSIALTNQRDYTFDTFNPFSLKGTAAQGAGLPHETITVRGFDEPFSQYCFICETVEVAEDNSWIEYKLRPEARFHDGSPITAEDVAFSFDKLTAEAAPLYRLYYADIDRAEARDPRTVRFHFKVKDNRELPLIIGELPVISRAYWATRDFSATTLDAPVGSGPYKLESFEIGRNVTYKRDPNYWAKDLPVARGMNNFDTVRFEYFRDQTAQFEAFKTGLFDIYREVSARKWTMEYEFPAAKDGRVIKLEPPDLTPMTIQSFILNLRRPLFQDRRVREALNYAFDFESLNRTVFMGQYVRQRSYAQNSELEPTGLPSAAELVFLEPLRDKIPPEVFTREFTQPVTNGEGDVRENLLKARELLEQAGWEVRDGTLVNKATGQPFAFEFLDAQGQPDTVEAPYIQNLARLGIKATVRSVDSSQLFNRYNDFDFDVTTILFGNSISPGNEQMEYWGSESANRPSSRNVGGVADPAVDALITSIIEAPDRATLIAAYRALDRVLTWNHYRVLTYGRAGERVAHWSKLKHPDKWPLHGISSGFSEAISYWWADPAVAATPSKSEVAKSADATPPASGGGSFLVPVAIGAGIMVALFLIFRRRRG